MADENLPARPRLRPIEIRPATHDGEQVFILKDPLRISPHLAIGLSLPGMAIAQFFDGERTLEDVQAEFARNYGAVVPLDFVAAVARELDQALFLEGGRVLAALDEWRKAPLREPACAGGSYPDDPAALRGFLSAQLTREGGPGGPPAPRDGKGPVRVVVSPHIDFHRGGHAYAWAWRAVAEACDAELFVVFGTAHAGTGRSRFALTRKSYDTPLGVVPTDVELVERVVRSYAGPDDLFDGEIAHKGEHSIEFQAVELAWLYGGNRAIRMLPVLCGSIHDLIGSGAAPSEDPRLRAFHEALSKALADVPPEKVAFVAGIDLAHVGTEFHNPPLDERGLERIVADDHVTLDAAIAKQDPDLVHADIARDRDARNICGHSALVATLEATRRISWGKLSGELLRHDRWYDGKSTVTFASAVLRGSA
jgi:AmmeMemoRadiSam system protein B